MSLHSTFDMEELERHAKHDREQREFTIANRPPILFVYKNHRDETEQRSAIPLRLYWGSTEFYPEEQWLLHAWDDVKKAERTFAIAGISSFPLGGL